MRFPTSERGHLPRSPRLVSLAAAVVLLVAACGSSTTSPSPAPSAAPSAAPSTAPSGAAPSPAGSDDIAATYSRIEQQVIAIRELQPTRPVTPTVLDDAGIKKLVADSFDKDNPPALIAANERIMKALGLLPADASLKDLYVTLLGSQVAGLYNPDDKRLYVVSKSGRIGAVEKTTFSHEFTHALQDQNFDLSSLRLDEIGQGDRSFARLSLVEGDATLSMTYWQLQNLTQADLGELLSAAQDDPSTRQLESMPPILRESLLFPYSQGLGFVQGLQNRGGWAAVNEAFAKPPASTEQILHPDKYTAGEQPVAVELPKDLATKLGAGWTSQLEDSFGEFQLGVWLQQGSGLSAVEAKSAAAGWGGDRISALEGPDGSWAVVLRTAWDTAQDATEFERAASPIVDGLQGSASLLPGAGDTERWVLVASDDAALNRVAGVLGLAG
ncbi:MAG TPA: hypothetical protein VH440_08905 [Candidatus Limnocylindrales bacterium]